MKLKTNLKFLKIKKIAKIDFIFSNKNSQEMETIPNELVYYMQKHNPNVYVEENRSHFSKVRKIDFEDYRYSEDFRDDLMDMDMSLPEPVLHWFINFTDMLDDHILCTAVSNGRPRIAEYLFDVRKSVDLNNISEFVDEIIRNGNSEFLYVLASYNRKEFIKYVSGINRSKFLNEFLEENGIDIS